MWIWIAFIVGYILGRCRTLKIEITLKQPEGR